MAKPVLIIFARAPRLGTVKRRLAAGIGAVPALCFHRNALQRIARLIASLRGFEPYLAITPDRAKFRPLPHLPVLNQGPGGLGQRMASTFRRFPRRQVILAGADIPALNTADFHAAARALKHHDAVFGPAADGGFYLVALGAKRPAAPFAKARWSSPHALADTIANFPNHRIAYLRTLQDVDTAQDLQNLPRNFRIAVPREIPLTRTRGGVIL